MRLKTWVGLLALFGGLSDIANAATFAVNSTVDGVDASPGDGTCLTADGGCTLRAAIMEANALEGADVVDLTSIDDPLEPIVLSLEGVDETFTDTPAGPLACAALITPDPSRGDLDIVDDLTVRGAGPGRTVIQWDQQGLTPPFLGDRIFHVQAPAGTRIDQVEFRDLAVMRGSVGVVADNDPESPYNCAVSGTGDAMRVTQFRRFGGGIAIGDGATVTVRKASGQPGGGQPAEPREKPDKPDDRARAAENGVTSGITAVVLERVAVIGNWSGSDAGGLLVNAATTIIDSIFSDNESSADGGALYLDSPTRITGSLIGASTSDVIYPSGPVDAEVLVANKAEQGGGIFATGAHTSLIERAALNGNQATEGGAIAGGSLVTLDIINSTISGNTATQIAGGITTRGQANLRNVTLANNRSASGVAGGSGGLNGEGGGSYTFVNTILANNTAGEGETEREANCGCTGNEEGCPAGRMVSAGFNLSDEATDTCSLDAALSDLLDTDPRMGPLSFQGGLTEVHPLPSVAAGDGETSPAIDAGTGSRCPNNDQRGSLRPDDGDLNGSYACDIGAYERFAARTDLHLQNVSAPDTARRGRPFQITIEARNDDANAVAPGVEIASAIAPAGGLSITNVVPSVGTCTITDGVSVDCALGDLAIGARATAVLTVSPQLQGAHTLSTTLTQSGAPELVDTVPGNNVVVSKVLVVGTSDISMTGGPAAATIDQGDDLTLDYVVTNLGSDPATQIRAGMVLPVDMAFVSATTDVGGPCTAADGEIACPIGDLAVDASANVQVVATAGRAGVIPFTASAAAEQIDPALDNNVTTSDVTVVPNANLGITLATSDDRVRLKQSFDLTLAVKNDGPQAATGLVVTSTLPDSVTAVPGAGCTLAGAALRCTAATLGSGATQSFTVALKAVSPGDITISASADAAENDPVAGNNSASVTFEARRSGGGGCAYNPGGPIDPTLPGLLVLSLMLAARRAHLRARAAESAAQDTTTENANA